MKHLSGYEKYLLMGKITHTLSDQETAELDNLFHENQEIKEAYHQLLNEYPKEWVENGFAHLDAPDYWINLKETASPVIPITRHKIWVKRLSVAAVAIGLAIGGWWYAGSFNKPGKTGEMAIKSNPGVQLKLANGEIINLNEKKGEINTTSGNFMNEKNSLTYSASEASPIGINTIIVPAIMNYNIVLSDGSEVFLNSMSQLTFPSRFSNGAREITISGEAYLKVAKDAARPFIVHLPNSSVEVLGTEFNVNSYDSGIVRVALVTGSINMKSSNRSVRVLPGQEATYINNKEITQRNFEARKVLGWRQGLYYYDRVSLNELTAIIERWFNVKCIIDNPALKKKVFVGVIDKNLPLESVLDDLNGMSRITGYFDKNGVLHFK